MPFPPSPYVEVRSNALYMAGTRVSLDSLITRFEEGASPERIAQSFPSLRLSQVYGAIAYYLENQETIRQHLVDGDRELERLVPPLSQSNPELFARLQAAREKTGSGRA